MGSDCLSYAGLALRAGKALVGTAACEKGIRRGQIRLLLLQQGLSAGSERRFIRLCERFGTQTVHIDGCDSLGRAVGRAGIMILGITDQGLADKIKTICDGGKGSGKA